MSAAVPSAREFAKRLTAVAYGAAGKEPPQDSKAAGVPLVPIFVGIDRGPEQGANRGEQEQLRETFLYRLGDDKWSIKPATSRLLLETGLPGGSTERVVEDQIKAGLKPYADMKGTGRGQQQLVKLQFYVRHGQQVFRDEVVWDVGNPVNGAESYAVRVCADLGLGADWFDVIRAHVLQQLDDVRQDLQEAPGEVELQQPAKKVHRTTAAAAAEEGVDQQPAGDGNSSGQQQQQQQQRLGVPRVEEYDAATDPEAARLAARQQKLEQRRRSQQQQQQHMAAAAAAAAQPQQQQMQAVPKLQSPTLQQQQQQVPLQPQSLVQQQQQQHGVPPQLPQQQAQQQLLPGQVPLPQQVQLPGQPQQQLQLPGQPQLQQQQQLSGQSPLPQQLQLPAQPQQQQPHLPGQQPQQQQLLPPGQQQLH